jgi:hypothetical protein
MIPVKCHKNLFRDSNSNAIINIDNGSAINNYRRARDKIVKRDDDIENLKADMAEIKVILKQLLEK